LPGEPAAAAAGAGDAAALAAPAAEAGAVSCTLQLSIGHGDDMPVVSVIACSCRQPCKLSTLEQLMCSGSRGNMVPHLFPSPIHPSPNFPPTLSYPGFLTPTFPNR
jgi:hypothetical protein